MHRWRWLLLQKAQSYLKGLKETLRSVIAFDIDVKKLNGIRKFRDNVRLLIPMTLHCTMPHNIRKHRGGALRMVELDGSDIEWRKLYIWRNTEERCDIINNFERLSGIKKCWLFLVALTAWTGSRHRPLCNPIASWVHPWPHFFNKYFFYQRTFSFSTSLFSAWWCLSVLPGFVDLVC